jgi:hypothetical protein
MSGLGFDTNQPFQIRAFGEMQRDGMIGRLRHMTDDLRLDSRIEGRSGYDFLEQP